MTAAMISLLSRKPERDQTYNFINWNRTLAQEQEKNKLKSEKYVSGKFMELRIITLPK